MKIKFISLIVMIMFFACTNIIEPERLKEKIYISAQGFDQVNILSVIDGEIQEEQEIISVNLLENIMDTPHFIEIDKDNNFWFVTLINSGKVLMFDLDNNTILDSIMVGDSPALMTHDSNQKLLYISRMMPMNGMMGMPESESNKIQVLDYSSDSLISLTDFELPAPAPHGLDLSDNGMYLFVASNTSDWVYKIDTSTGEIIAEIYLPDPENPFGPEEINYYKPIQLKYFNQHIFISCSAGKFYNGQTEVNIPGKLVVLNSEDLSIITVYEFSWTSSPWHLSIDESTSEIFIALAGDMGNMGTSGVASLSFLENEISHNWTKTGLEFSTCHGIAISQNSNQVYLSGRGNGILHTIDRNDGSILQTIAINSMMDGMMGAMLGGIAVK